MKFIPEALVVGAFVLCAGDISLRAAPDGLSSVLLTSAADSPSSAFKDFQRRVDKYLKVRSKAAKLAPPSMQTTDDVGGREALRQRFAEALRASRQEAVEGDIFTPRARAELRGWINAIFAGDDGRTALTVMSHEAPLPFALEVNATYPDGISFGTMSPALLARLPPLPVALEFRLVGRHLILRDVDAGLIVDIMRNALPEVG